MRKAPHFRSKTTVRFHSFKITYKCIYENTYRSAVKVKRRTRHELSENVTSDDENTGDDLTLPNHISKSPWSITMTNEEVSCIKEKNGIFLLYIITSQKKETFDQIDAGITNACQGQF